MSETRVHCPSCNADIGPAVLPAPREPSITFEACARRCEPCGIGLSNGLTPTTIYRDPHHNLPAEVRVGARETVDASLNKRNRGNKWKRLGFSTSEDAVTWTVFSWLARSAPAGLAALGERCFGSGGAIPDLLLWGVPVPAAGGANVRKRIIEILIALGEARDSLTEPDVVLGFGRHGLVIIEVKHRAANDRLAPSRQDKFDRYLAGTTAFADAEAVRTTGLYELTRNWRLGTDLAGARPFRLVNLGPESLFEGGAGARLDSFETALSRDGDRAFMRATWAAFLPDMAALAGGLPTWMADWLRERGIDA